MTEVKRLEQKADPENNLIYSLDQYGEFGLLSCKHEKLHPKTLAEELLERYRLKGIFISETSETVGEKTPEKFAVTENDLKFIVHPKDEFTGLQIDQEPARKVIQSYSNNKDVLDLFAYNGAYAMYAFKGNAGSVSAVESNSKSLALLKKNLQINKLDLIDVWEESYENFLDLAQEDHTKFDIIILNLSKPVLATLKNFDINKDLTPLVRRLQSRFLRYGGFIFFITDIQDFIMDAYIRPGADKLTKKTVPEEFLPLRPHQSFAFYN